MYKLGFDLFEFEVGVGLAEVTDFGLVEDVGGGFGVDDGGGLYLGEINLHPLDLYSSIFIRKFI